MEPGTSLRVRTLVFALTPALVSVAGPACERDPSQPEVSPTEALRLELEQVDDGTTDVVGRLGTINFMLELNWTSTPDPLCAGEPDPNATTFVATVEALPSRLQPAGSGSADGTWNCFGFAGEVRLDDGTRFALRSDDLTFESSVFGSWRDSMSMNRWSAGNRRGYFRFGQVASSGIVFDTHLDAVLRNASDEPAHIAATRIGLTDCFAHRDIPNLCGPFPDAHFAAVPPQQSDTWSWPNGMLAVPWPPSQRPYLYAGPISYLISIRFGDSPAAFNEIATLECFLDPANDGWVEVIIDADRSPSCGEGWVGGLFARVSPNRLFLQPGETDSATVHGVLFAGTAAPSVSVTSSSATVRVTQRSVDSLNTRMTVTADSGAGLTGHSITATLATQSPPATYEVTLPVEVYVLDPAMDRDTITVPRGAIGTADVYLNRYGIEDESIHLEFRTDPPNVFRFPPSFVPAVTREATTAVNLPIHAAAAPGDHDMAFCARIENDPSMRCHEGNFVLRITDANSPPAVSIVSPESGYSTLAGNSVLLRGLGIDPEEGPLTGSSLVWTSSINGNIGIGESLGALLPAGDHTIILTGTDSFGASASDTITVSIVDPNFSASIVGQITRNGFGLGGATILLDGPQSGSTTSSANGSYAFTGLPAGTYTVVVSAPGTVFLTNSQTVTLANGESVFVDFAGN